MNLRRDPEGRAALRAYDGASFGDRLHVRVRWLTCPFSAIAARVPENGRILDLGCGHGLFTLYLALGSPGRAVAGRDVDEHKLVVARAAAERAARPVAFSAADDDPGSPGTTWDAVTIVDVLYLLGEARARSVLAAAAAELAPGGVLVVKEMSLTPRWKLRLAHLQELLATRVLRITQGDEVEILDPEVLADEMRSAGLEVVVERIDRRWLHPHVLVVGRRTS